MLAGPFLAGHDLAGAYRAATVEALEDAQSYARRYRIVVVAANPFVEASHARSLSVGTSKSSTAARISFRAMPHSSEMQRTQRSKNSLKAV